MSTKRFRVALSFPGEKRDFIRQVADLLAAKLGKECVLYDEYLTAELARPDLDLHLGALYRDQSELLVPFYCADYERKQWCKLEWRQMRDILFNVEGHRIMPFRFDDSPITGVLSIDGYAKIGTRSPQEVVELILQRLSNPNHSLGLGKKETGKRATKLFKFDKWKLIMGLTIAICATSYFAWYRIIRSDEAKLLQAKEPSRDDDGNRIGLLHPADDPWEEIAPGNPMIRSGAIVMMLGGTAFAFAPQTRVFPVLIVDGKTIFELTIATNGMSLTGQFSNKDGGVTCNIESNRFVLNTKNFWRAITPDKSTLIIKGNDIDEELLLSVRFRRTNVFEVTGIFYLSNREKLLVKRDQIVWRGLTLTRGGFSMESFNKGGLYFQGGGFSMGNP